MTIKYFTCIFLFLIVMLSLCGCDGGEDTAAETMAETTGKTAVSSVAEDGLTEEERTHYLGISVFDRLSLTELSAIGEHADKVNPPYSMDGSICVPMSSVIDGEMQHYTAVLSCDGTLVETVIHEGLYTLYEGEVVGMFWMLDESGTVLGITNHNTETQSRILFVSDNTGAILHETVLDTSANWQAKLIVTEQYYVLHLAMEILIFDHTLVQTGQIMITDGVITMVEDAGDGTLTASVNHAMEGRHIYYEIIPETGAYTVNDMLSLTGIPGGSAYIMYGADYHRYYASGSGIYGWLDGSADVDTIAAWAGVGMTGLMLYDVVDMNTMLVSYEDVFEENFDYYLLRRGVAPAEDRGELVLGLVGLGSSMEAILTDAASGFNRSQDEWYVSVRNYPDTMTAFETRYGIEDYLGDLITEDAPDIVSVGNAFHPSIMSVAQKGGYADLTSAFGDVLLPSIRRAYETEHGLYAVPLRFTMDTFITASEDFMDGADLSEVIAAAETLGDDEALYSMQYPYQLKQVLTVGIESFIDRKNQTCSFDSDEFADFIRFYDALEQYNNTELGFITGSSNEISYSGSPDLVENLSEGRLSFLYTPVYNVEMLFELTETFRDVPFSFCGYPSDDGMCAFLRGMGNTMITADTPHPDGALAFMNYLFSDAVQSAEGISLFGISPMTDALEEELEKTVYVFDAAGYTSIQSPDGVPVYYRGFHGAYREDDPGLDRYDGETKVIKIRFTEDEVNRIRSLFHGSDMQGVSDDTVLDIVNEELSYWQNDARSLEDTARIIQSRVWICLNE